MLKAVILAGGKSTRTYPLTLTRPKPLLPIAGIMLIEHTIFQLQDLVDEIIFIVGYKKSMLIEQIINIWKKWSFSKNIKFTFIEQKEQLGTAHAVLQAENNVNGNFFVLNGDDLYSGVDFKKMSLLGPSILVKKLPDVSKFSSVFTSFDKELIFEKIIEKPASGGPGMAGLGMYLFDCEIFDAIKQTPLSERGEYEMTEALNRYVKYKRFKVHEVTDFWYPIGYPWDVLKGTFFVLNRLSYYKFLKKLLCKKQNYIEIKKDILVGQNTVIKNNVKFSGRVVIGSNVVIGDNSIIAGPAFIGDGSIIKNNVLFNQSIIFSNALIDSETEINFSVLGNNVHINRGCKINFYFHNNKEKVIKSSVKGEMQSTEVNKLGIISGDNVCVEENCIFSPGIKISPNQVVQKNRKVVLDIN
jgi:bifunctional UDP-N-acetylglucosamine pyrophosphorylase/glucosamine-1-phosphate N-acetyltransferase